MEAEAPKRRAVAERRSRRDEKAETVVPQQVVIACLPRQTAGSFSSNVTIWLLMTLISPQETSCQGFS